jgi:acyl-CoA thioester hydrolase
MTHQVSSVSRSSPQPEGSFETTSLVRVRYAETDAMGVVYYSNYLVWFEIGRCEWLRRSGCSYREMEESGIRLPVIETRCEYKRAARYDDEVEVRTRASLLSPARVGFEYRLVRRSDGALVAAGHTVHAAVDLNGRPRRLPPSARGLFQ